MALSLSAAAILEKNKLSQEGSWLLLVEIDLNVSGEDNILLARALEDVTWPSGSGSETYTAFPVEFSQVEESLDGTLPNLVMRASNAMRTLETYLQTYDGFLGGTVTLRVVHSDHLDETDPEVELVFEVLESSSDEAWVELRLGMVNPLTKTFPPDRYNALYCRHKFKGSGCQYIGGDTTCDHTLEDCQSKSNSEHFGGSPGMRDGIYTGY